MFQCMILKSFSFLFFFLMFMYLFFLASAAAHGLSLAVVSVSHSLVAVHRLLIFVASLVPELGLKASGRQKLWHMGLAAPWRLPCIGRRILRQESPKSSFFTHRLSHAHRWTNLFIYHILHTAYNLLSSDYTMMLFPSSLPR